MRQKSTVTQKLLTSQHAQSLSQQQTTFLRVNKLELDAFKQVLLQNLNTNYLQIANIKH
jgi:hypothetical protein